MKPTCANSLRLEDMVQDPLVYVHIFLGKKKKVLKQSLPLFVIIGGFVLRCCEQTANHVSNSYLTFHGTFGETTRHNLFAFHFAFFLSVTLTFFFFLVNFSICSLLLKEKKKKNLSICSRKKFLCNQRAASLFFLQS